MTEYDIDNVLVEQARAGRRVVRLLDGDPLLLPERARGLLPPVEEWDR